jgi:hypothetical protein
MYEEHPSFKLPEKSEDKTIWHYMDLPKFIDLISKKSLFFTKASRYPDPCEGTIPKHKELVRKTIYEKIRPEFESDEQFNRFINNAPEIFGSILKQYRDLVMINSWHLSDYESAALWESYGTKTGIAIQTTIGDLKESFTKTEDGIWIGCVNYIDFNHEWMDEWNIFEAFVIKRPSFSYEAEIRAVTCLPDNNIGSKVLSKLDMEGEANSPSHQRLSNPTELTKDGKYVKVDLEKLINLVYVSPMAPSYFKNVTESVVSKYGFDKKVLKSDLYTLK